MAPPSRPTLIVPELLEALIEAPEPDPSDLLIQAILEDLKHLNDKVVLLGRLLGGGEPLRETG